MPTTLQDAIGRILLQFDKHQSLRLMVQNTLSAIIETEIGPLISKAGEFKAYVHKRLDDAGVPKFDDGRECRVGARLDWALDVIQSARALRLATNERLAASGSGA